MMNFNETLIRSSSVGYLMTEPVTKADKEAGVLSKTAQKHLIEVYVAEKYGRKRDVQTKQMKKGIEVEDDSIELLNNYLGVHYMKNQHRFTNDYISGHPDILTVYPNKIIDIKSSYDLWTFLGNIPDKLDNLYYWQLQSYMWLTDSDTGHIAYCLTNTPFSIIEQEKRYLLNRMNVISEESPEYQKEALKLEFSLTFDDIDISERILMFNVERNEEDILKIQNKVLKARTFLQELEQTHLNFNK